MDRLLTPASGSARRVSAGPLHYGWIVVIGCAFALFCTSGLGVNSFSAYQPFIISENGFTNTQSSLILTVRAFFGFLAIFLSAPYYRKLSLRAGYALALAIEAMGFLAFGLARTIGGYYFAAALVGAAFGLGTFVPVTILIERWFVEKRALAAGIAWSATGLASFGVPTLITALVARIGLGRSFMVEAVFVLGCAALCFLLLRDEPSRMGMSAYGAAFADSAAEASCERGSVAPPSDKGASVACRAPEAPIRDVGKGIEGGDWIAVMAGLLALGATASVGYSHLTVLASSSGFTPHAAALAVSVSGVALIVGKIAFGALSERASTSTSTIVFSGLCIAGLGLLCFMGTRPALLFVASGLYGIGLATSSVGISSWASDLSVAGGLDRTIRRFQIGYCAGGFVFAPLPGLLADLFGGSYVPAYLFFIACTFLTAVVVLRQYAKRREAAASSRAAAKRTKARAWVH